MINDCGAIHRMKIGSGNRSARGKSFPVSICPPQIPQDFSWDRTRSVAVEIGRYLEDSFLGLIKVLS
jgi:hypothetical protein